MSLSSSSFLPSDDQVYLKNEDIAFVEDEENGQKVIILKDYLLPKGKFDIEKVDILICLPGGYPDQPPDMFFFFPWAKLANGKYPKAADQPFSFKGKSWQRWSRHSNNWTPGVDSMLTMIIRIKEAIKNAQ